MAPRGRRRSVLAASAALGWLVPGAWAADAARGGAQAWAPTLRRLELTEEELAKKGPKAFSGDYMHADYTFSLRRENMERDGEGELWLSFPTADDPKKDASPKMRLRGVAKSTRFGEGTINIWVDAEEKMVYTRFKLGQLHKEECIKYPFPDKADNNMHKLHKRMESVDKWKQEEQKVLMDKKGPHSIEVKWTRSGYLEWLLDDDGDEIRGFNMHHREDSEDRVVKSVLLDNVETGKNPDGVDKIFGVPDKDSCKMDDQVPDPQQLAKVELVPKNHRSSALNDLLLVLQDHKRGEKWSQLFVLLSAITVPGDVSVLIEDPAPPDLSKLHNVRFEYEASVMQGDQRHTSDGAIWFGTDDRTFRLRGEAKGTKVGNLTMDLVAKSGDKVYANVDLKDQFVKQCVSYDYPEMDREGKEHLHELQDQDLAFFAIAELNGEDCGIFVAELNRGRWLHIWVDMEKKRPHKILRTEVHKNGEVLRSTDIVKWSDGKDVDIGVKVDDAWKCEPRKEGDEQLARLGLARPVHKKSVQLQDSLYALQKLNPDFALLEVLGLTGDVGIMVQEPKAPDLISLPTMTFTHTITLWSDVAGRGSDGTLSFEGDFAANKQQSSVRITAIAPPGLASLAVAFEGDVVAVQVVDADGQPSCLTLKVKDSKDADAQIRDDRGLFDGVEEVGDSECNRFSYFGTGPHKESVEFWFSMEERKVCRLEVLPPVETIGDTAAMSANPRLAEIDIPEWSLKYEPSGGATEWQKGESGEEGPEGWKCRAAAEEQNSWLSLAAEAPVSSLPAAIAMAKLAEAAGVVGLLPEKVAHVLSRIVVTTPGEAVVAPTSGGSINCEDVSGKWIGTSPGLTGHMPIAEPPTEKIKMKVKQNGCNLKVTALMPGGPQQSDATIEGNVIKMPGLPAGKSSGTRNGNTIVWDGGDFWIRDTGDDRSQQPPISVLSDDLQSFSFTFKSSYPLMGDKGIATGADGDMSYSPTNGIGERRRSSIGEVRVDLANRWLYLQSEAVNVSAGIPKVTSKIILRGDQAKLYARTKLDLDDYDQCWMVNTTKLPVPLGKKQPNPFQYSDHAGECEGYSEGDAECKERRVSWLDGKKRLEFYIDQTDRLLGMVLDDTETDVAAGITIQQFSTEPSDPEWFEPTTDWKCQDLKYLPDADHVADWSLISAFFPVEPARQEPVPQESRRLFEV